LRKISQISKTTLRQQPCDSGLPTNSGRLLRWWVGSACRDRNDHQPPVSFYVNNTAIF